MQYPDCTPVHVRVDHEDRLNLDPPGLIGFTVAHEASLFLYCVMVVKDGRVWLLNGLYHRVNIDRPKWKFVCPPLVASIADNVSKRIAEQSGSLSARVQDAGYAFMSERTAMMALRANLVEADHFGCFCETARQCQTQGCRCFQMKRKCTTACHSGIFGCEANPTVHTTWTAIADQWNVGPSAASTGGQLASTAKRTIVLESTDNSDAEDQGEGPQASRGTREPLERQAATIAQM